MAEKLTTALLLSRTRAAWTSLRDKKGQMEVAEQVDAPLDIPAEEVIGSAAFSAAVKARCSGVKGVVTLVLPTEDSLIRVVELPSTDPEEIRSMAELQVERFSPFPTDQMCVGHEVLAQSEGKSRVLVAAAPRSAVDALHSSLAMAKVQPLRVDVEAMGWWWSLKAKGRVADSGRQIFLMMTAGATELLIAQDGQPVQIRSLSSSVSDTKSIAAELVEEIEYTLTTLETEWGASPVDRLHVWSREGVAEDLLAEIGMASPIVVERHALSELSAVSECIARRIVESGGASLDLAPPEWKATALSLEEQKRMTVIAVTILAIWIAALGGLYYYAKNETMSAFMGKERIKTLDKKADEVRELQKQVQSLQRYADRSYSALECLREVCTLMPAGPELDSFNYEKYNIVSMRGYADSDAPVFEFFQKLQTSQLFPKVDPGTVTQVRFKERQRSQFKVTIKLPEEKKPEEKKK